MVVRWKLSERLAAMGKGCNGDELDRRRCSGSGSCSQSERPDYLSVKIGMRSNISGDGSSLSRAGTKVVLSPRRISLSRSSNPDHCPRIAVSGEISVFAKEESRILSHRDLTSRSRALQIPILARLMQHAAFDKRTKSTHGKGHPLDHSDTRLFGRPSKAALMAPASVDCYYTHTQQVMTCASV